jgi:hypothetical protein
MVMSPLRGYRGHGISDPTAVAVGYITPPLPGLRTPGLGCRVKAGARAGAELALSDAMGRPALRLLGPVLPDQPLHPSELRDIRGYQDQVAAQRLAGNQQIVGTPRETVLPSETDS